MPDGGVTAVREASAAALGRLWVTYALSVQNQRLGRARLPQRGQRVVAEMLQQVAHPRQQLVAPGH